MPFTEPFINILAGHLIYGWGMHRFKFTGKYGKAATKPRWMEDYGIDVKGTTDFGSGLKGGHTKYGAVVDKGASGWCDKDSAQKCKGGIWWATRNSKHVHFYLGGLDIDMVVGSGQARSKGITCRELRWIYRFRADPAVQSFVQFWRPVGVTTLDGLKSASPDTDAEQCCPPWLDTFAAGAANKWAAYAPKGDHDINGVHV